MSEDEFFSLSVDRSQQTLSSGQQDKQKVNIAVMQYLTEAIVADIQYICGGKSEEKKSLRTFPVLRLSNWWSVSSGPCWKLHTFFLFDKTSINLRQKNILTVLQKNIYTMISSFQKVHRTFHNVLFLLNVYDSVQYDAQKVDSTHNMKLEFSFTSYPHYSFSPSHNCFLSRMLPPDFSRTLLTSYYQQLTLEW